jgi:hypothetical protein
LSRYPVSAVFHGHAHNGMLEGRTSRDRLQRLASAVAAPSAGATLWAVDDPRARRWGERNSRQSLGVSSL